MRYFNLLLFLISLSLSNTVARAQEKWMEWTSTNCYENIEYRVRYVKSYGTRHEWELQFRNNYENLVVFNYGIEENSEAPVIPNHRKTLRAGEVSKPLQIFTGKENFFLYTDKLSFSVDGLDPLPCD